MPLWQSQLQNYAVTYNHSIGPMTITAVYPNTTTIGFSPPSPHKYFSYIEGISIRATNPSGSGVTLTVRVVAIYEDYTEDEIVSIDVSEGETFDDWLRWMYDAFSHKKKIKAVEVRCSCSDTPASGYEPSVAATLTGTVQ